MHPLASNVSTPTVYSENDWNTFSPKEVEEKGKDADPLNIYFASKTLADRGTSLEHQPILRFTHNQLLSDVGLLE
jgi:hypothetical protein